jgi:hypothetical protein
MLGRQGPQQSKTLYSRTCIQPWTVQKVIWATCRRIRAPSRRSLTHIEASEQMHARHCIALLHLTE